MTSIVNAMAAFVAIVTVSFGGLHAPSVQHLVKHTSKPSFSGNFGPSYTDPAGTDAYYRRGRTIAYFPPPPPPAPVDAAPADDTSAPGYVAPAYVAPAYVAPAPRPAPPPVSIGSTQQALINQDRAAAGLGPLTWSSCLAGIAYQNGVRMANQGFISHAGGPNQDLGCGLGGQAGENVGYWSAGINDYQLNTMFMNSPEHRANIMGPYHYIGTAWVVAKNGYAYIAVEFS